MNLISRLTLTTLTLLAFQARGETYPALGTYKTIAEELIVQTKTANSTDEVAALIQKTRDLIAAGTEITKLYGQKNPNCSAQFTVFLNDMPKMETMSLEEVETRYHDGAGLPAGPKNCYFGRSEVIHPVMNLIRMKQAWTSETREEVLDDLEEVVEHLPRIQHDLDNPPN